MAKKIKKIRNIEKTPNSRSREKARRICRKLDRAALLLVGLIGLSVLLLGNRHYDLGTTASSGFPALFLLVLAYLPLELFELLATLSSGHPVEVASGWPETLMLGSLAVLTIAVIWAAVRFYCAPRFNFYYVQNVTHIFYLLIIWGIFQLICFLAAVSWNQGSVSPLLRTGCRNSVVSNKIIN